MSAFSKALTFFGLSRTPTDLPVEPAPDEAPASDEVKADAPDSIPVPEKELRRVKFIHGEMLEARKKLTKLLLQKSEDEHTLHLELDALEDGLGDELQRLRQVCGAPGDYLLTLPRKRGENGCLVRPDPNPQSE